MRHILGIDPGLTGAIAVIDENFNLVDCFRMPVKDIDGKNKVDAGALFARLSQYRIELAILEKVGTRQVKGLSGLLALVMATELSERFCSAWASVIGLNVRKPGVAVRA